MTEWSADGRAAIRAGLTAGRAADKFRHALGSAGDQDFLEVSVRGVFAPVPTATVHQFVDLLDDVSEGRAVTVAPSDILIGTSEAARLLGVSRTWVARLVDDGKLPSMLRGSKRRLPLGALVKRMRVDAARMRKALEGFDESRHDDEPAPAATAGVLVGGDVRYTHVGAEHSDYLQELMRAAGRGSLSARSAGAAGPVNHEPAYAA